MKRINRVVVLAVALATPMVLAQGAFAQGYPSKRITLLIGYGAGTNVIDLPTRLLGDKLEKRLGQPVTPEYRPGAQSQIAFDAVHNAEPDGYTLGLATIGLLTLPLNVKNYTLDPLRDLTPVGLYAASANPLMVLSSGKAPYKTLAEFVAYAKANPGKISIGGIGSSMQMEMAMLEKKGGFKLTPVAYKGRPQMVSDLMAGDLDAMISDYDPNKQFIAEGRMNLLGVGSTERIPDLAKTPSISEVIPGYEITSFWFGIIAPPKTPESIVNRLNDAINRSMQEADVAPAILKIGMKPLTGSVADFRAFLLRDKAKFTEAANLIGLKPQ